MHTVKNKKELGKLGREGEKERNEKRRRSS